MKWAFSIKFGRQKVNEVSKRFNIKGVVQMEDGSSSGIVSDNAQTVVLDDLEEVCYWTERNGSREMWRGSVSGTSFHGLSTVLRKHTYNYEPEAGLNLPVVHCGFARVVPFVLAVYSFEY
jgi:hypothetical protein